MTRLLLLGSLLLFVSCSKNESVLSVNQMPRHDYSNFFEQAFGYCTRQKLNDDFFFLVDIGVHSGYKRFYIYDFAKESVIDSFMVSHGCAGSAWGRDHSKDNPVTSNIPESHATSLGKYVIGERGYSQWGVKIKYLLHGMESTNSNALKRTIVLHSWEAVTKDEKFPNGTAEGWGCPALSNQDMLVVDSMLLENKQNTLLWIINSKTNKK